MTADKKTETFRVSELVYYNTKELGKGKIVLPDATSSDIYFNGVVGNILYMTDNKKENLFSLFTFTCSFASIA